MDEKSIAALQAESRAFLQEIVEANRDLNKRLADIDVCVSYEPGEDLFTLMLGDPQEALTESIDNVFYIRVDPESLAIVGIEVPYLSERLQDHPDIAKLWRSATGMVGPDTKATDAFAHALQALVTA